MQINATEAKLKLTSKNRHVIRKIKFYLESHYINDDYLEEIMKDIVGMALESQKRGEDFSETVGLDYGEFCKELVENSPKQTYTEKIFNKILSTIACLGIVLPIMYLLALLFKTSTFQCRGIMLVAPLGYILKYMAMVLILQIGLIMAKRSVYKPQTILLAIYVATIVLAIILSDYILVIPQVHACSVEVNILIWLAAFIAILLVVYFLKLKFVSLMGYIKKKFRHR